MEDKKNNIPVKDWIQDYKEQFKRYNAYCEANNWIFASKKDIENEYDAQKIIVKIILGRLKYFISKFEPYLDYKYSQEFIDLMLTPVLLYIERCNTYISTNNWLNIDDKEEQIKEVEFQSDIISDSDKVKDELQKLNLDDEVIYLDLPIHSDKKIPFLMKDTVENRFPQIKVFKETLVDSEDVRVTTYTAYDVADSTEMFINMKNPPPYNPTKHYFEQSKDVTQFYEEELDKIRNGITIAGVYIHGWLYWHINYFKTDMPMEVFKGTSLYNPKKELLISNPPLRDNELFLIDMYKEAEVKQKGLFAFGTRRYAKTVGEASFLTWRTVCVANGEGVVIGGDEGDLAKLSKTLEIGFSNIHPAFYLPKNNNDWSKHIQFGLKDKTNERIPYSDIFIKNVNGGRGQGTEKAAGASPSAWIADEAGKFNIKTVFESALPSFHIGGKWRTVPLLVGTGGNVELSVEAQEMLLDPIPNDIIAMNWDKLRDYVKDEDLVTWKERNFGVFLPAQMSLKNGLIKKRTTLSSFLDINDEALDKIEIRITDWKKAKEIIENDREVKKHAKNKLNREKMYYPLDPLDCFLNRIENPFCQNEAMEHYEELLREGNTGRTVEISKGVDGLKTYFSDKEVAPFPFKGGNIDSPVLIFEDPPNNPIIDGTYTAGLDHYKHDKSSTDSLGVLYIFKRNVNLDEWGDRIVACYASRPDRIDTFNQNSEILLEGYGAECLMENADISFQQYLRTKFKDHILLARGVELARREINPYAKQNNDFGLNPSKKNQAYLFKLVQDYANEWIVLGVDEEGNKIEKRGVTRIPDPMLVKEMIDFNYDGNFDRIVAFGHALAWARYLDSLNIMPKVKKNREESTYKKQVRKQRVKYRSPYSGKKFNPYKR